MKSLILCVVSAIIISADSKVISPSHLHGKVFGGTPVDHVPIRIMASIQEQKVHYCGSCIVSSKVLLASAACTEILRYRKGHFREIEAMPVNTDGSTPVEGYAIDLSLEHPTFTEECRQKKIDIDVGIFVTVRDIQFEPETKVKNIDWSDEIIEAGSTAEFFGWDVKECDDGMKRSPRVVKIDVKILSSEKCQLAMAAWKDAYFKSPDLQMCAKGVNDLQHPTPGDVGSPMILGEKVVGFYLLGPYLAMQPYAPIIFYRVQAVRGWIDEMIAKHKT